MYPDKVNSLRNFEVLGEDRSIVAGEVVSSKQTQAGFAIGVKIKFAVQYLFQEAYIKPGTKVYIKFPEFKLLQK